MRMIAKSFCGLLRKAELKFPPISNFEFSNSKSEFSLLVQKCFTLVFCFKVKAYLETKSGLKFESIRNRGENFHLYTIIRIETRIQAQDHFMKILNTS